MSLHLCLCAIELEADDRTPFTPRHKLAMWAFADSGSEQTRISMPGLEAVMKAASVKRARALGLTRELVSMGLLAHWKQGYRGHRAEFLVFPNGCCEKHGPLLIDGVLWSSHLGLAAPAKQKGSTTVDPFSTVGEDRKGPRTLDPIDPRKGPRSVDPIDRKGSTTHKRKGSTTPPERVHHPRSNPTPSLKHSETNPNFGPSYETGPVTSRATRGTSKTPPMDFGQMLDGHPAEPARELAGPCGECEKGWILGADGTPLSKCPQCHPGYQRVIA